MTKKPVVFNLLTVLFVGIIVSFPVQIMFLYGHYPWEVTSIFSKLSFMNWLVAMACGYAAYISYHADPKLKWFLPLMTLLVAWNNIIVGYVGFDYTTTMTLLGTVAFGSINGMFLLPQVQKALANPTRRWWLNPLRYQAKVPVFVNPLRGGEGFYTDTYDISASGTFIPLKPLQSEMFSHGETVALSFTLGAFRALRCNATIVRNTEAKGNYPSGMGIKFNDLSKRQKDSLNQFFKTISPPTFRVGLTA